MPLDFYDPQVSFYPIYSPRTGELPFLRYNHDVDIIRFKGIFFALWNANETPAEGVPGQYNYLSWSKDFITWSKPNKPFTASGGCINPVETDNQWQPSLINWNDEILFCAWCDYKSDRTFVASSEDGFHWKNTEVPSAPPELAGKVTAFPSNHGLLLKDGTMLFPASLPDCDGNFIVGNTRYAAALISTDKGKNWNWGNPVIAESWNIYDGPASQHPDTPAPTIWEPMIYEENDGVLGMLIRNSSSQDDPELDPLMKPHWMLLYASSSDGGRSWTKCRPVEVDTIISRNFSTVLPEADHALLMIMNDWIVNTPARIDGDRFNLAFFVSPSGDPDLLLPGPLVQPPAGRAFYPNGFAEDGKLYLAYTYPNSIMGTVVESLPDFSKPFLMKRAGRTGLVFDEENNIIRLGHRWSTLCVVLTRKQTQAEAVTLSGTFELFYRREERFPLLTVGGKTRNGGVLATAWDAETAEDILIWLDFDGSSEKLAAVKMRKKFNISVTLTRNNLTIFLDGGKVMDRHGEYLRKFAFGGLYETPEYPTGRAMTQEIRIFTDTIQITV
ncbi:MAG: exo-alpha-sialidase [Lentisphaeria bacterium]|nr:exo-alpha-sialidase [Lentisphaeria bacterium]